MNCSENDVIVLVFQFQVFEVPPDLKLLFCFRVAMGIRDGLYNKKKLIYLLYDSTK